MDVIFSLMIWYFHLTVLSEDKYERHSREICYQESNFGGKTRQISLESTVGEDINWGKLGQIRNSQFSIIVTSVEYWIWNLQILTFLINLTPFSGIFQSIWFFFVPGRFHCRFCYHHQRLVEFWARLSTKQCTSISICKKVWPLR